MKSSYWRRKARQPGSFLPAASRLGPCEDSRAAASWADSPSAGSTSRSRATCSTSTLTGLDVYATGAAVPGPSLSSTSPRFGRSAL